jgi:hypothetical protein
VPGLSPGELALQPHLSRLRAAPVMGLAIVAQLVGVAVLLWHGYQAQALVYALLCATADIVVLSGEAES